MKVTKKVKTSILQKTKKPIIIVLIVMVCVFLYLAYIFFAPNIFSSSEEKSFLYVPDNSTFDNVIDSLNQSANVLSIASFKQVAGILKYGKVIRPGRYELKSGMNNFKLIRALRSGRQTPVKLTFNNIRTKEQLAARLSHIIMADSASIVNMLNDNDFLMAYGLNSDTSISLFIPDTYEVFWDLDAMELFTRMKKEHDAFWNDERKSKAAEIPLTPTEVSTLASIVEEETNAKKERPMVAGLYINRLKMDMPLQADPTLKFAFGDFGLKRILFAHILKISPYNTYRNRGLPPGPIRVASRDGIDAVLNYSKHNYIFMCAKETLNGEHNFAVSYSDHQINAQKYQKALNDRKIFK